MMHHFIIFIFLIACFEIRADYSEIIYDIVIYGGSSSGTVAAIQGARMGKSVALIEPSMHLGGMTSNGLGWVDVQNSKTIGGIARNFFHRIWTFYQEDTSWIWESKHTLNNQTGTPSPNETAMWVFEPHVAENIFDEMIGETNAKIFFKERINREKGVIKTQGKISKIIMESGKEFRGKIFIDASYEGDLMAAAGVSYIIGREANDQYGETLNGIRPNYRRGSMPQHIDPYIIMGNPESGLLPRIHPTIGGDPGSADKGVQAYNYRMCLTDIPENRVAIEKPENYDELQYEIVFRAIPMQPRNKFFKLDLMPNRKTDSNNYSDISTDYTGMSWNYVEASYSERDKIAREHEDWQRGLIWTLQNHPRIPSTVKSFYAPWGLPKDEFQDNNHWPHQIYIREGRRMIADYILTEHTVRHSDKPNDPVVIGSYFMDSHSVKYCVGPDGYLMAEGAFFAKGGGPFSISYRTLVPKRQECENLIVPVCLSSSHVGYGAVRLEPTIMMLGQSAATAASLAIDFDCALQDVPYDLLREHLIKDGQILAIP